MDKLVSIVSQINPCRLKLEENKPKLISSPEYESNNIMCLIIGKRTFTYLIKLENVFKPVELVLTILAKKKKN